MSALQLSADARFFVTDIGVAITNIYEGSVFELNESGATAFLSLVECGSPDEAVRVLLSRWDVAEEEARRDVSDLVRELTSRGLIDSFTH